jgi:tetratricopeptide (TPR) repeat protein
MIGGSSNALQALLQTGFQLLQQGRAEEAWNAFHQVLQADPDNALAHHMVGLIAMQAGQLEIGVESMRRSIALQPGDPVAHGNLGNGLRDLGRLDEALAAYAMALALAPDFLDALNNRAILHGRAGRPAEALQDYDRALAIDPAVAFLHNNRAEALRALGRFDEALAGWDRAVALDPGSVEALYNRANLLADLRRREAAARDYEAAIALNPAYVQALLNFGNLLVDLGRQAEALALYDRVLALQGDLAPALSNRANALRMLGRYDEALESCDAAIRLDPAYPDPLLNRAGVKFELGRVRDAVADYEACLSLKPDMAEAGFTGGMAHLSLGDYERGWELYEARLRMRGASQFVAERNVPQPYWRGQTPLQGKTLLLFSEQGLGDTLQFCRYVPLMHPGAKIVLEVEQPSLRLLSRLPGVTTILARGDELPPFDLQCPLMSLPRAFRTTLDSIPADTPYLFADDAAVAVWRARLAGLDGLRVGLVWAGQSRPEPTLAALDRRRSVSLARMAPLGEVPGVHWISLQKGEPAAESKNPPQGMVLHDFTEELDDFDDTAALIANLDLVITIDSAVVHLAGALGKPVWLLNRFDTCWRWLLGRDDSLWYPTLRQFRQPRPGDWDSVILRIREALQRLADGDREQLKAPVGGT